MLNSGHVRTQRTPHTDAAAWLRGTQRYCSDTISTDRYARHCQWKATTFRGSPSPIENNVKYAAQSKERSWVCCMHSKQCSYRARGRYTLCMLPLAIASHTLLSIILHCTSTLRGATIITVSWYPREWITGQSLSECFTKLHLIAFCVILLIE